MLKIGLIDLWLDNWHTNYYPGFLRDAAREMGMDADLVYVYAEKDAPGGMTNREWCEKIGGVTLLPAYEDIVRESDVLMFMCADDVFPHERLARKALMSGKRLYCDKTFAPDTASARRMFRLAKEYGTAVFSSSAMRFCPDLTKYSSDATEAAASILLKAYEMERSYSPDVYRLLKFGKLQSGTARNALSPHCRMEGSLRSFRPEVFGEMQEKLTKICADVQTQFGCRVEIHFTEGYPAVMNNSALLQKVRQLLPVAEVA